ncbi:glycosyltransferase family 4 protein [Billgrantia lactosivorans]|uniref:glycosyltransferase family 4 protein n=1 Tax=Billgrantia lactosivorans TaxID=2185141 RepID=UPI000DAB5337|nr:glycosyltransferase family 4 protein [Halomonas lactosivorans]
MPIKTLAIITSQAFSLVNFRGPLIRDLVAHGIRVYALAPDYCTEVREKVMALGAEPVDISLCNTGMNPFRDLLDTLKLARLLKRIRPDATFGYFIKPVIYGAFASRLAKVPRHYSMVEGRGYVFEGHSEELGLGRRIMRRGVTALYRRALALSDCTIFLNRDDMNFFQLKRMVTNDRVARIHGIGLDLAHFMPLAPHREPIRFVMISRMLTAKGVYEFVEAARRVKEVRPEVEFCLVGGTDTHDRSVPRQQLVAWRKQGLVEWVGHSRDVRYWLARASVYVLPSWYGEGVPRGNQEAMAMARPVITTDWVGCRDTVVHGHNGLLVPPKDPQALASAMLHYVEHPQAIEEHGRHGRSMAERLYDVRQTNSRIFAAMGLVRHPSRCGGANTKEAAAERHDLLTLS